MCATDVRTISHHHDVVKFRGRNGNALVQNFFRRLLRTPREIFSLPWPENFHARLLSAFRLSLGSGQWARYFFFAGLMKGEAILPHATAIFCVP
jgi:hypothetical protein